MSTKCTGLVDEARAPLARTSAGPIRAANRRARTCTLGLAMGLLGLAHWAGDGASAAIVREAADIPDNAGGLGGFVNACRDLLDPVLVAIAALAPFAVLGGILVMLFGGRRGPMIIGGALLALVLAGSANGIVR